MSRPNLATHHDRTMDLGSILLACSLHVDDPLVASIAHAYSRGNPHAVMNVRLTVLDGQDEPLSVLSPPTSAPAARAEIQRIIVAGGAPLVGLLPVRPEWAIEFGKKPDDLFDPCTNVAVASAKLSELEHDCQRTPRHPSARDLRVCILARYGALAGLPALSRMVLADVESREAELKTDALVDARAPAFVAGSDLFFPIRHPGPLPFIERRQLHEP